MFDWDENDRFSAFDDSDRFEEDSLCSLLSEPESVCNNWRGWKKDGRIVVNGASGSVAMGTVVSNHAKDSRVLPLVEMAAREVACNIPFEIVERHHPPVPEELQLRIAYWSFPENEEDIRLYSCLANGSADEFTKGESLLKLRAVNDLLQIGFHLSATVDTTQTQLSPKGVFNVAVTFDRRRITSCSCTCPAHSTCSPSPSASWCLHVVSVCLFRIHQSTQVCLRAPVSESLSRLHRDQLQKFAQYLISELPQQILPTAQKLLDDLLSSKPTKINKEHGAPDPTAGASASEQTSWCLDENQLKENIKKILVKLTVTSPIVFSDVNYLTSTAPPAAAEWASLLRPLRGREPEGMWNLLSIVREMFRRGDLNSIPLLEILTEEIISSDQIILWWFNTRVSLYPHGNGNRASMHGSTNTSQHACSSLCDELVVLWRLACLNPRLSPADKDVFFSKLHDWHIKTIERVTKQRTVSNGNGGPVKKTDLDVFSGFKPAIEACLLRWDDYPIPGVTFTEANNRIWYCSCIHASELAVGQAKCSSQALDGTCSAPSCPSFRGRGRSVEIGCHDRSTPLPPVAESTCQSAAVSMEDGSSGVSKQTESPVKRTSESSVNNIQEAEVENVAEASNRSSISSEGFCDNSESELVERDSSFPEARGEEREETFCSSGSNNCDTKETPSSGEKLSISLAGPDRESDTNSQAAATPVEPEASLNPVASTSGSGKVTENTDKCSVMIKKVDSALEILFARAEALHAHGFTQEACRLAVQLAEEMLTRPPNLMVELPSPPARGKRQKKFNPASHQISLLASATLSKAAFLCSVLTENSEHHYLAFRVGLFGLELARPPASTKALEVKLANQEMDLVSLFKKMPLMSRQLQVLRDTAEHLRDGRYRSRGDSLLPLVLASYIFDSLVVSVSQPTKSGPPIIGRLPTDELLGFEAAVGALGLKANVSEAEHPLLCEGTRRQRGDLAITLLIFYKDDQEKLTRIMDRLLDKEVHQMFKNPMQANSALAAAQVKRSAASVSSENSSPVSNASSSATLQATTGNESLSSSNSDESLESRDQMPSTSGENITYPRDSRPRNSNALRSALDGDRRDGSPCWDEDFKAWEAKFRCTNLKTAKKQSVGMASIDSSAPETTSSDNSPTVVRRSYMKGNGPGSDSGSSAESSDSFVSSSSTSKVVKVAAKQTAGPSGSGISTSVLPAEGSQAGVVTITNHMANASIADGQGKPRALVPFAAGPSNVAVNASHPTAAGKANSPPMAGTAPSGPVNQVHPNCYQHQQPLKPNRFNKGKRAYPSIPNQPSEASAHFMFELAKTVLSKAGGNSNTAVLFTQQPSGQSHRGPHRALHMCAFQIGVYALGLHNAVSPNWLSRTYSSHVSWITGQATEIGAAAISFLTETWERHLTPPEVASLADRASRGRDPQMVKAAANLALSCLPHAHALNPNEIARALIQCKEQSNELLERACLAVESAAKGGGVYPEVLFEVARKWFELYEESLQEPASNSTSSRRRTPYVQPGIGEFMVPSANSATDNGNNMAHGHEQPRVENAFVPMVPPQPGAPMQLMPPAAAAYAIAQGAPGYPYGFYSTFASTPQLSLHPAYISSANSQPFQYNPYFANANMAAAGIPPHLRSLMPPGAMYAGQPLMPNVVVTQAAISQAQARFQMLTGQLPHGLQIPGLNMHPNITFNGMAHSHHQPQPMQQLNQRQLTHLLSAYRVGMLALETLARKVVDDRSQSKYARNPSYGEHVKWLLNCAKKLGTPYLQDFCICAVNSVTSPFILYDIIIEAVRFLQMHNSPPIAQPLRSPLIVPLLQKCQQMFMQCTHSKMYHITPADYEEFVQVVLSARSAFQLTPGGMVQFNDLLQSLRRSKSCKKDLWQHLTNSLQQQSSSSI
ncbi:Zinc finger SWIM domain-containing protein 8 [Halotydeus destructor]|nr:Zinc finger SWIM domain-containing protein 8 [Halotydeus destructor]